jgi:benzoylformate decarboxylase
MMGTPLQWRAPSNDIQGAVAAAFKSGKPHLIEVEIEGKR